MTLLYSLYRVSRDTALTVLDPNNIRGQPIIRDRQLSPRCERVFGRRTVLPKTLRYRFSIHIFIISFTP